MLGPESQIRVVGVGKEKYLFFLTEKRRKAKKGRYIKRVSLKDSGAALSKSHHLSKMEMKAIC